MERPDGAHKHVHTEVTSLSYNLSGSPSVELIGVALVLRWCVIFCLFWCLGMPLLLRMPSILGVANATSVYRSDLAWGIRTLLPRRKKLSWVLGEDLLQWTQTYF